jgi:hypothetical protein
MKDSKNMVIGMLCAVVCVMAVAYAAFSTSLNVTTTATVASNWCVKVQKAECEATPVTGGAEGSATASANTTANALGATFTMKFTQPGDTATCTVTYENCGSLNAAITHKAYSVDGETASELPVTLGAATYTTAADGIEFAISGLEAGTLSAKTNDSAAGTTTITIIGKYLDVAAGQGSPATKSASIRIVSSASKSV